MATDDSPIRPWSGSEFVHAIHEVAGIGAYRWRDW